MRRGRAAEKGENPRWCSLCAGYKAFGSELNSVSKARS